jgi:hypothetical protein
MFVCHSERSEESVVPRRIGCLQILRSAKNAELRMTESPLFIEGIQKFLYRRQFILEIQVIK